MSSNKTNKSFAKRIKVRKSGKLETRKPGFNHFNAKQPRSKQLAGKRLQSFKMSNKTKSEVLPHH